MSEQERYVLGVDVEEPEAATVHALTLPCRAERLATWCELDPLEGTKGDLIALSPEKVSCVACIERMREVHAALTEHLVELAEAEKERG